MKTDKRPITLDAIREPVRGKSEDLEHYFRKYLRSDVPVIDRIFEHLVEGGGKRFRPLLVMLIASSDGDADPEDIFRLAVSVEFVHTATLLHDDVVDQSDLRRGNRVAYRIWGAEPSVLSGDYLYSRAFNLLVEIGRLEILDSISSATTQMARGEVLQLLRSYSTSTSRKEYLEVIEGKTASLIAASCRSAGYLAGYNGEPLSGLEKYGMNLGMSFQIVDDMLDYSAEGQVLGKAVGKDFLEGKITLPVILLMDKLQGQDRNLVAEVFMKDEPQQDDFFTVLSLMEEHGILEETRSEAKAFARKAADSLNAVPDGPKKESLLGITQYVVQRNL